MAYDSVMRDVLHNIHTEFHSMKLGTLIHMHLNETYSSFQVGKHFFDTFPVTNFLIFHTCFSTLL